MKNASWPPPGQVGWQCRGCGWDRREEGVRVGAGPRGGRILTVPALCSERTLRWTERHDCWQSSSYLFSLWPQCWLRAPRCSRLHRHPSPAWPPTVPRSPGGEIPALAWALVSTDVGSLAGAEHPLLPQDIACVSAWFGPSSCSNALPFFFLLSSLHFTFPFSSYYSRTIDFLFFELLCHLQPSALRESLQWKEHIIQTLHITNKEIDGSGCFCYLPEITKLV